MISSEGSSPGVDTVVRIALESRNFFQRLIEDPRATVEELRRITDEDVTRIASIVAESRGRLSISDALALWDEKHMIPSWNNDWKMKPPGPWPGQSGPGGGPPRTP